MVIPIYVIKRTGKKPNNEKYKKVQDRQIKRRQKNADLFDNVRKTLDSYYNQPFKFKDAILLADSIAAKIGVKIDRDARRSKDTLICWFCENWSSAQHFFQQDQNSMLQTSSSNTTIEKDSFFTFNENEEDLSSLWADLF